MNLEHYRKAKRYAWRLDPSMFGDLVHDAYISEHKKGRDLFKHPLGLMFRVIKFTYYDHLKNVYGQTIPRYFEEFDESKFKASESLPEEPQWSVSDEMRELCELLESSEEETKTIISLKAKGYSYSEIAVMMCMSKPLVILYLKKSMSTITNPFTGKQEKGRSISLHQYEKLTDKEDYEYNDENEFYKIYLHKESLETLLVKLPVAKTNPYLSGSTN